MAKNTLTCLITGKSYTFTKDYFKKKVEDYADEDALRKYFITKKARALIARGYSVEEIRNILEVDRENLLPADSQAVKDLVDYHNMSLSKDNKRHSTFNFSNHKSDPDVIVFINNIKGLTL